jgi:predicted RNA-binding protein associated with RNAse of E/G family
VTFEPGEIVYMRHFQHDVVSGVFPLRAVRHDASGVLLWGEAGSRHFFTVMADGRWMRETPLPEWVRGPKRLVDAEAKHSLLSWHPSGADYSIRFFFDHDGRFLNWYANLEVPAVPWRADGLAGLDTVDWDLDVVIDPDRSWRWKDEEEFAERLRTPEYYWVDDERRVRQAGLDVIKLVEAGDFPFDGTWTGFRPDTEWGPITSSVPLRGWDLPRAR